MHRSHLCLGNSTSCKAHGRGRRSFLLSELVVLITQRLFSEFSRQQKSPQNPAIRHKMTRQLLVGVPHKFRSLLNKISWQILKQWSLLFIVDVTQENEPIFFFYHLQAPVFESQVTHYNSLALSVPGLVPTVIHTHRNPKLPNTTQHDLGLDPTKHRNKLHLSNKGVLSVNHLRIKKLTLNVYVRQDKGNY